MPEGDTIHYAARRVRAALVGQRDHVDRDPHPRHRGDRWPERLAGRGVRSVDAHGKHLFIRFEGDLTLHSHLRMTGKWGVYRRGERWRRSPRRAWLVIRTAEHEVVQFDGPVLELMTESRTRFDPHLAALGPDVLAPGVRRARLPAPAARGRPTRGIGDALLDQRNLAGIGNIWKAEACFAARLDPWRPLARRERRGGAGVSRERPAEAMRPVRACTATRVKRRVSTSAPGCPCPRCGTPHAGPRPGRRQPHHLWCPGCQA